MTAILVLLHCSSRMGYGHQQSTSRMPDSGYQGESALKSSPAPCKGAGRSRCPAQPSGFAVPNFTLEYRAPGLMADPTPKSLKRVRRSHPAECFRKFYQFLLLRSRPLSGIPRMIKDQSADDPVFQSRHSSACLLAPARVDLNTIQAWFGHARLGATDILAEIDIETKAGHGAVRCRRARIGPPAAESSRMQAPQRKPPRSADGSR